MELKEYTSRHLGVPYVYLKDEKKYLCENGVVFTKEETDSVLLFISSFLLNKLDNSKDFG